MTPIHFVNCDCVPSFNTQCCVIVRSGLWHFVSQWRTRVTSCLDARVISCLGGMWLFILGACDFLSWQHVHLCLSYMWRCVSVKCDFVSSPNSAYFVDTQGMSRVRGTLMHSPHKWIMTTERSMRRCTLTTPKLHAASPSPELSIADSLTGKKISPNAGLSRYGVMLIVCWAAQENLLKQTAQAQNQCNRF